MLLRFSSASTNVEENFARNRFLRLGSLIKNRSRSCLSFLAKVSISRSSCSLSMIRSWGCVVSFLE
jgi:hypothetical protein